MQYQIHCFRPVPERFRDQESPSHIRNSDGEPGWLPCEQLPRYPGIDRVAREGDTHCHQCRRPTRCSFRFGDIKEFLAVLPPHWICATSGGDLPLSSTRRKTLNIDLFLPDSSEV